MGLEAKHQEFKQELINNLFNAIHIEDKLKQLEAMLPQLRVTTKTSTDKFKSKKD